MFRITRTALLPIFMLLALMTGSAWSQDSDSVYTELRQRAGDAYKDGDYRKSVELYRKCLEYPEGKRSAATFHFNIACNYSLLSDVDLAFDHLQQSIKAGYEKLGWIQQDSDLEHLRTHHADRLDEFLQWAAVYIKGQRVRLAPMAIIEYENYDGPGLPEELCWDAWDNHRMDTLRNRYGLAEIAAGNTEFERILAMLDWVSNRWDHTGNNAAPEQNALAILTAVDNGERFRCVEYATVVTDCLNALGYPARPVSLRMGSVSYGTGKGHLVIEVWSNQFQKWIVIDGQNDAYWAVSSIPQSSDECRRLLLDGQSNQLQLVGQKDWDYDRIKSTWAAYFHHLVYSHANASYDSTCRSQRRYEYLPDSNAFPELYFQGFARAHPCTSDRDFIYPTLNRVHIDWTHGEDRKDGTLDIKLRHTMPFFDTYLVKIDDGQWSSSPGDFSWATHAGENSLEIRAVNKAGIEGRPSKIVLVNNLDAGEQQVAQ